MKTAKEITEDILSITQKIENNYPELLKYFNEMPVRIPNAANPAADLKSLIDYFETLSNLFNRYRTTHDPAKFDHSIDLK
jgi:hypothetical protein